MSTSVKAYPNRQCLRYTAYNTMGTHLLRVGEVRGVPEAVIQVRRGVQEQLVRDRVLVWKQVRAPDHSTTAQLTVPASGS